MEAGTGTISLCLIVRDEEENLARCLDSVRGRVDEIVVVDTGSRDATPAIAESYGAVVISSPWQNDFSQARNVGLEHANKEWVLVLDADEELPAETAAGLRQLAAAPDVEAWTFTIVSLVAPDEDSLQTRHLGLRMFRNRASYRFEGRIHEQIKPSLLQQGAAVAVRYSGLSICHYGYIRGYRREKTQRNIAILREVLAENPEDAFVHYNLGVSYYTAGQLEDSRRHFEAALRYLHWPSGFAAPLYRNYCICLHDLGEYSLALKVADQGLAHFPDYPDLYFCKGQAFWDLGMLAQARASFYRCSQFRRTPPEYTTTEGVTGYLAWENLAEIYARELNFQKAIEYMVSAVTRKPSFRLVSRLCSLLQADNVRGEELAGYLTRRFGLAADDLLELLFAAGEYETCLARIDGEAAAGPETLLLKARCLLRLGRHSEAVAALSTAQSAPPLGDEILKTRCLGLWLQDPRQDAGGVLVAPGAGHGPATAACQIINCLVTGEDTGAPTGRQLEPDLRDQILALALEALVLGDKDLALAAALAASGGQNQGESYFLLGRLAVARGLNLEARKLLEWAVNRCQEATEAYYLLGVACSNLGLSDRSLACFLRAAEREPANELYAICALEQLIIRCLEFVAGGLNLEANRIELRQELFKLTGMRKKLHRCKEALINNAGLQP